MDAKILLGTHLTPLENDATYIYPKQLLELLEKNTEALNGVKLALAVMTGKHV